MKNVACVTGLLLALLWPVRSFAEITMFVSPDGDGAYILEGDNAQGVEALDLLIGYDADSLANPKVEAQGGTITDVYAGTPGMLNVTIMRDNPDTSFELHLKFDKKGDSPEGIYSVSATARGRDGRNYAASADTRALSLSTMNPAIMPDKESAAVSSVDRATETQEAVGVYQGTSDKPPDRGVETGAASSAGGTTTSPEQPAATKKTIRCNEKSVLERFREFKGEKGLKEFGALFKCSGGERIMQEPAIALSDGETPVLIKLELQPEGNNSPDIALSGAKLVSSKKVDEKSRVITTLPNEGAWEARLVLGSGNEMIDFPLVVAPPVKIDSEIHERNFLAALNNYLSGQAAILRGKSEQSRDEYIFTANYLANLAKTSPKKASW
jgi:hypothetical protein